MKRDVMRQKAIGPFAPKKAPSTETQISTSAGAGAASSANISTSTGAQSRDDETRLTRLQECLKADQVNPFIDSNEPDIIDRRDISAVLDQHIGPYQGSGVFGRKIGHSLKLGKFGVYSAPSSAASGAVSSVTSATMGAQRPGITGATSIGTSMSAAKRLMMPAQREGSVAPMARVWPASSNATSNQPNTAGTEGVNQQVAQDSVIGNAIALGRRPS